jgi:hypothetical protein
MALPIRDGNQSLTTLSTILVSNSHIPAHTVVSFGTQGITDIATAVSGVELGPNTLNALENITVTLGQVTITGGLTDAQLRASAVTIGGSVTATISGAVSVTFGTAVVTGSTSIIGTPSVTFTQASVTFSSVSISNFPATQPISIASVTIGNTVAISGSVTLGGGTAQIGSVTASISNFPATQPISISSVTIGSLPDISGTVTANVIGKNPVDDSLIQIPVESYLDASSAYVVPVDLYNQAGAIYSGNPLAVGGTVTIGAGTAQIGSVTASISGTPSITFGTAVVTGSTSILNFPATQTVTFTQSSVTFGQSTITGSVSILNFPSSQTVTFTQASVTFGTAVITGSTSIIGTPSVTFSQAPVTFGLISGTVTASPTGTQTIAGSVTLGAGTAQIGSVTASISGTVPISISSVTIGNSVTIGSLPAISGTVTANVLGYNYGEGEPQKIPIKYDISDNLYIPIGPSTDPYPLPIYGAVTASIEVPYIKVNINVINVATDTIVSNVYLRKIGEYTYESIRYQGGEDEAYLRVYLDAGDVSTQKLWRLYSYGAYADLQGLIATIAPQNAGSNNGDALPPKTGWSLNTGITGTLSISYEQPSAQLAYGNNGLDGVGGNVIPLQIAYSDEAFADGRRLAVSIVNSEGLEYTTPLPISGTVTIGSALPAGTNRIGVVTIGGGTVTIGAGTAQIGSVTASISGTVTIFPVQGTSVTTSNFTSTTPSQTIASASSGREILTIFNEGAGNLHVCAGSTCTTIGYQVRLSSGDYWECPTSQVQLIHTAVFATTGTARVTEIG